MTNLISLVTIFITFFAVVWGSFSVCSWVLDRVEMKYATLILGTIGILIPTIIVALIEEKMFVQGTVVACGLLAGMVFTDVRRRKVM